LLVINEKLRRTDTNYPMHLISQKSVFRGYRASDFKAIKLVCLISDKKRADSVGWEGGHGSSWAPPLNSEHGRGKKQECELTLFHHLDDVIILKLKHIVKTLRCKEKFLSSTTILSVALQNQGSQFASYLGTLFNFSASIVRITTLCIVLLYKGLNFLPPFILFLSLYRPHVNQKNLTRHDLKFVWRGGTKPSEFFFLKSFWSRMQSPNWW
jgi:hypothetical protein